MARPWITVRGPGHDNQSTRGFVELDALQPLLAVADDGSGVGGATGISATPLFAGME